MTDSRIAHLLVELNRAKEQIALLQVQLEEAHQEIDRLSKPDMRILVGYEAGLKHGQEQRDAGDGEEEAALGEGQGLEDRGEERPSGRPERHEDEGAGEREGAERSGEEEAVEPFEDRKHPGNGPSWHTGKECIEPHCRLPAGTAWSPHWCFTHNVERLRKINQSFAELQRDFE